MIVTSLTSRYLPNITHFLRIGECDRAVILDLAEISDRNRLSFVNRNRIPVRNGQEDLWLTVPINRVRGAPAASTQIDATDLRWRRKHIETLRHFYPRHRVNAPSFLELLDHSMSSASQGIVGLNRKILSDIIGYLSLDLHLPILQSSVVDENNPTHRLDLAAALRGRIYLAGPVEHELMQKNGDIERLANASCKVFLTKAPGMAFDTPELSPRYSIVHPILTLGINRTSDYLLKAIEGLRSHYSQSCRE